MVGWMHMLLQEWGAATRKLVPLSAAAPTKALPTEQLAACIAALRALPTRAY